ncbi:hypothetical protein VTN00DRAFT_6996 [Thermoascus crustaceus]|uniref:uncharacterized protein n=1 Tax=Thermoascus crustaceus TaxID=5088 RepID=UPI003744A6CC
MLTRLTLSITGSTHHGVAVELIEGYLNQVNAGEVKPGQDREPGGGGGGYCPQGRRNVADHEQGAESRTGEAEAMQRNDGGREGDGLKKRTEADGVKKPFDAFSRPSCLRTTVNGAHEVRWYGALPDGASGHRVFRGSARRAPKRLSQVPRGLSTALSINSRSHGSFMELPAGASPWFIAIPVLRAGVVYNCRSTEHEHISLLAGPNKQSTSSSLPALPGVRFDDKSQISFHNRSVPDERSPPSAISPLACVLAAPTKRPGGAVDKDNRPFS